MRFSRLSTERFGNLPDRMWEFGEGLQIVQGPNEAGKTSLQQALTWVLYGDATSVQQGYSSRRRWGETEHFALELVLALAENEYRLVRDFQARHNRLFLPDGKRISSKEQIRQWVIETVKLPTEASFAATACICQDELAVDARGGNIQSLLEQHVLSGSGANVDLLLRKLKGRIDTLRRGMDHPAKNLGPIRACEEEMRRAEEELSRLRGQYREGEQATEALEQLRVALDQDAKALDDARAYLAHDGALRETRRRGQEATERLKRVQDQQRRLADLQRDIPERAETLHVLQGQRKGLEDRLTRSREATRILQRLDELSHEVAALTHDLTSLESCHAELAHWGAQLASLPLRADEIQSALHLPREIAALQEELDQFARRHDQLQLALVQGEVEVTASGQALQSAQAERRGLEERVQRTQAAARAEQRRQTLHAALQQKRAALAQIETLDRQLQGLEATLLQTAALDAVDGARLSQLPGQIRQLDQLLTTEGFEIIVEPLRPLDIRAEQDGRSTEYTALDASLQLQARQALDLEVSGVVRLRASNRSKASLRLTQLQEELARLLAQSDCASAAEYSERRRERDQLMQRRENLRSQLALLLQGTSLADIQGSVQALEAELRAIPALPLESDGEAEQALQGALAREADARDRLGRAAATVEVLREQLRTSPTGDNLQAEVQRKQDVLSDLLQRAEVSQVQALLPLQQRWEECNSAEQRLRSAEALILAGRREADMRSRSDRLRLEEKELQRQLLALGDVLPSGAEMDALEAEYVRAAEECERLDSRLKTAQAELQALSSEPLEAEHTRYLVDLATAEMEQREHVPFALSAEERLRYERRVKELEAAVNSGRVRLGNLQEQSRRADNLLSRMADLEETLAELDRQREHLLQRAMVDEQVRLFLEAARKQAIAEIYARLPGAVATRVQRMTQGAHSRVSGDGLDLALWSAHKGGPLHEKELSRGTRDQFYLALRLTLLDLLFSDARPPLLLDDPLVHCDPDRRREILALLADYAQTGQVLLFTCHTFAEYDGFPVLHLER